MARHTPVVTPEQFSNFGDLLKFLRRRAGLTQRELALTVGYSESQISRLEKNMRAPDGTSLAARFIPALDLDAAPEWATRMLELGNASYAVMLPQEHAPAPVTPNNLPIPLTSFVGRQKELAEIRRWLTEENTNPTRLITLTGHGGCGKTRLALETVRALLDVFPDGVWFIELATLTDGALVSKAVATVLGIQLETAHSNGAQLPRALGDKRMLLVLDNCEHLIEATARVAQDLLESCPNLRILATSREMLGAEGEHSYLVRSLSTPDTREMDSLAEAMQFEAVRLFVERAAAVSPDFVITEENAPAVAQICRQLDGIPLAIELAAARLRMMPVEQIEARLDNAFRLLSGGARTALPRHQTLQALMDWSYDLLTVSEQVLLRRLAVFAGGWTLEAAESICTDNGIGKADVMELLARLIDKSLVLVVPQEQGHPARYRLLETMRQYAMVRLAASGEAEEVRRKHAEYYFVLAAAGAPQAPATLTEGAWLSVIQQEQDNLQAALTWSLTTAEQQGPDERTTRGGAIWTSAWALNRLGWLAREKGDLSTARLRLEKSLEVYRSIGDPLGIAWSAITLGEVFVMQHEPELAVAVLEEGLALAREQGDAHAIGWGLNHLGHVAQLKGDTMQAETLHGESLEVFQTRHYKAGVAWAHQALGETALTRGDAASARQEFAAVMKRSGVLKDMLGVSWVCNGLGGIAALEGDARNAVWFWSAGAALRESFDLRVPPASRATFERLAAQVLAELGETEYEQIWNSAQEAGTEEVIGKIQSFLGALRSLENYSNQK